MVDAAALLDAAKSVLRQLCSPVSKEFLLLWNVDKDLKSLKETIETITNFLHDADQMEHLVTGGSLSRLTSVLHDADDLFDAISYRALHKNTINGNTFKKEVLLFFSKSNHLGFIFDTSHKVKDLRKRIDGINKDIYFEFHEVEVNPTRIHDRKETETLEDVIGRDDEREEILSLLLHQDSSLSREEERIFSIISIIGFAGLGKTTLAKFVYSDERVKSGFDMCLWACISHLSDMNQVLMAILTSVLKYYPGHMSLDLCQEKLRESFGGKKYLLVLDDVSDEVASNWYKLKPFLSCGKSGSKVLVTTTSFRVAQCLDSMKPYYNLNALSEESAWSLFVKMAFEEGELSHDSELVSLGKEVVRKCGYVPFALVTVGSMLRCSKEKEKKSLLSLANKELSIKQALKFSYNELPLSMKHCFAYCSLFPKGSSFDKDELVLLWLAHGFLQPHPEKSLEEVGEDYFFHFVNRCFFHKVTKNTFEMHDLLHDLAIEVAGTDYICLLEENLVGRRSTLRHISARCHPDFLLDSSGVFSHSNTLRTLLFDGMYTQLKLTNSLNSFLSSFRMLRALKLSGLLFNKVPDSIGGLIHLRYLDLARNSRLQLLPNSVCKLHHLQTLKLTDCHGIKELPSELGKLVSLRHLFLSGCFLDSLPSGLATLTSLVTLDKLIVHTHKGGLGYLGRLDGLCGVLKVVLPGKGWSNCIEDARRSNMYRKQKLSGMHLSWSHPQWEVARIQDHTKAILEEFEPPRNIQHLRLERCHADALPSWFSSLSSLKTCTLEECRMEYIDVDMGPCLEILEMKDLYNLKGWWRDSVVQCLPNVSELVIEYCPNLMGSMPVFKGVEKLTLRRVNGEFVSKLLCTPTNHHYNRLKELSLDCVLGLKCLPKGAIRHLTSLNSLTIRLCDGLSWVSSCGLACLTSLQVLDIRHCGYVRFDDIDDDDDGCGMPWKGLQRLRILYVCWQSHLQEGLQHLTSLEELEIVYSEANQVERDNECLEGRGLMWKGLKRLHRLNIEFALIGRCEFPKWIRYLSFLKHLEFRYGDELTSMSWAVLADMKLDTLHFHGVRRMISGEDLVAQQQSQFNSLLHFRISNLEESLVCDIPWKLFGWLPKLELWFGNDFAIIPEGIQHLTSLQVLEIHSHKKIEGAIPKWMISLTSLRRLQISDCSSQLVKRCQSQTGVDWHLISHIPHINIKIHHTLQWWSQDGG